MKKHDGLQVVRADDVDGPPTYEPTGYGVPVEPFDRFVRFVADRNMSPNTQPAYGYDLRHFVRFLAVDGRVWTDFRARHAPELLHYLRHVRASGPGRRSDLRFVDSGGGGVGRVLAPTTVHRVLGAVASFYEWASRSASMTRTARCSAAPIRQRSECRTVISRSRDCRAASDLSAD
jgi:site-specific recombinase XerD